MEINDKDLKNFGLKLRNIRSQKNISREELAKISKINKDHIGRIERGETNISIITMYHLAKSLECSFSDFFDD